jgi:hypothetical protein
MKLIKRFTYKGELVTIQKGGFMQYYFELADGVQRSYPRLTARGAERQVKQVIDDVTGTLSSQWNIPRRKYDHHQNSRMGILYFLAEEPIQNDQQQDCCLIVEVHAPDRVDDQWAQQAAENAIEEEFGKAFTLWSANEDEALQYLRSGPGVTQGLLDLANGVPLVWYLLPIV